MILDRKTGMKKIVWLCFTVLCSVSLYAQEPDTTVTRVDSLFTTGLEEVVADLSAAPSDKDFIGCFQLIHAFC